MVNGAGVDHENIRDGAGIDTELVSKQSIILYIYICLILCICNLLNVKLYIACDRDIIRKLSYYIY